MKEVIVMRFGGCGGNNGSWVIIVIIIIILLLGFGEDNTTFDC